MSSLALWEGKLISGSYDKPIRVWELEMRGLDATLTGHRSVVSALLVHGERLFSASADGTIRAWAVGTSRWAAVASVEVYDGPSLQFVRCLTAIGSKLISGSTKRSVHGETDTQCEVRMWDVDSPTCEHTVRQPAGVDVRCLAVAGWEVWGGVGWDLVVWERE